MENKQIKELMVMMERTGTKRLSIKKKDLEIELERDSAKEVPQSSHPAFLMDDALLRHDMALHRANAAAIALGASGASSATLPVHSSSGVQAQNQTAPEAPGQFVKSPMVGTFYSASAVGVDPYVKVGDRVEKDTVVCIIEAMKVMNEIKAGVSGVISEVLIENNHPVEFGTKLFRIT